MGNSSPTLPCRQNSRRQAFVRRIAIANWETTLDAVAMAGGQFCLQSANHWGGGFGDGKGFVLVFLSSWFSFRIRMSCMPWQTMQKIDDEGFYGNVWAVNLKLRNAKNRSRLNSADWGMPSNLSILIQTRFAKSSPI